MYAIAFDLTIGDLKKNYGEPYNNAYVEVRVVLKQYGFFWTQESVYLSTDNNLASIYQAINALSQIEWFKKSVRDIRAFKVEDWSDFTDIIKNG